MNNNMKEVVQSAIEFSKKQNYPKGFFAGDGDFWIKCDSHEVAQNTRLKYILFVIKDEATVYQA